MSLEGFQNGKGRIGVHGLFGPALGFLAALRPLVGVMLAGGPWRPLFLLHGPVAAAWAWLPADGGRGLYPLATRPRFQPLRGRSQEVARQDSSAVGGVSVSATGATGSGSGATATGSGSAVTTGSEIASVSAGGAAASATAAAGATVAAGRLIFFFCMRKPRLRRMPSNSSPEQPTSDIMSATMAKPPPSTDPAGRTSSGKRARQKTRSRTRSARRSSMSMRTTRVPQMR